MRWIYRIFILGILLVMSACAGIGYKSVLFHTRSNIGLDLDSVPATSEITIAREEGVIAPGFEDGKTLPVEASFKTNSRGLGAFFFGVDASFATGEAAVAMTALYGAPDATLKVRKEKNDGTYEYPVSKELYIHPDEKKVAFLEYPGITLQEKPKKRAWFSFLPFLGDSSEEINYVETGLTKPLIFGTNTSLGASIEWNTASKLPNSAKLGFNRKEIAWVPVSMSEKKDAAGQYVANIPSLLATISSDIKTKEGESVDWMQHFATGVAATNLARRSDIRRVLLKDALPGVDAIREWKESADLEQAIYPGIESCVNQAEDEYLEKIVFDAAYNRLLSSSEYKEINKSIKGWKKNRQPQNLNNVKKDYLRIIKVYTGDQQRVQHLINHQKIACLFDKSKSV